METKFKVGDRVFLTNPLPGDWGRWAKRECSRVREVKRVSPSGYLFDLVGCMFTHLTEQFEIHPDVLTIILRRPADRKSIENFLDGEGFKQGGDQEDERKTASRIINVHLAGPCAGQRTYNGPIGYHVKTKQAIAENNKFLLGGYFDHKNIKVIKSKPSVTQAIEQIKKYI